MWRDCANNASHPPAYNHPLALLPSPPIFYFIIFLYEIRVKKTNYDGREYRGSGEMERSFSNIDHGILTPEEFSKWIGTFYNC